MWLLRGRTQRIFGRAQRCLVAAVALQVRALALTPGSRKGYFVEQSWTVPVLTGADEDGLLRLPEALQQLDAERWPSASRARKACRKGEILINGTVGRCINDVSAFDVVSRQLRFLPAYYPANDALKKPFDMEVVYEDQHLGVVNKPAGPSTYSQHGNGGGRSNIRTCLPFVLTPPRSIEESDGSDIDPQLDCLRRPQPCHRLDAATSGLLVASKTAGASIGMERIFRERLIEKTYVALVIGSPAESHGVIDSPLIVKVPKGSEKKKADFGKGLPSRDKVVVSAVTEYTVTGSFPSLKGGTISRLTLKPKTGRTHQLRRHCADVLGCPIVGDDKYDFASPSAMALRGRGLFLCATEQKFCHPITGEPLHIRIDEPPKFQSLLDHEAARWRKFQHDPCTDDDVSAPAVAQQLRQDDDDDDDDDDDCAAAPPSTAAAVDAAHVLATCWDVGVLFVANALGTIVEYNASDGTISRTFSMPDLKLAACTALMLFPDHVLATYSDATMRWVGKHRLDSVEATISLPQEAHVPMARMPKFKHISACAASPAYDQLLLGTAGGTMYTVDLSGTFELAPRELPPPRRISDLHAAPVTALAAVHVAGEALLVTAGLDGLLEVWQLPAGNLRGRHLFWAAPAAAADALRPASLDAAAKKDDESDSGQEIAITSLAAAHSDALLAVGLVTGGVSLVHCGLAARAAHGSMLDMVELAEVQLFHGAATAVAFDVGLLLAVGCCEEKGVFIIDCSASARNPFSVVANADVDCGGIAALTWHAPDELLVATDGGGVACFSVPAAAPSTSMTLTWACAAVHAGPVTTLLALPAGKVACLTPAATQLAVVNVSQQESCGKTAVKTSSAQHASGLLCMAVSLARDVVATGDGAGGVVLWAVGADGALAEVASLQGLHAGEVLAVAFCGGGVASAGVDGAVFVSEFDVAEKAVSPEEASAAATARDAPPPHYALVERARHATARPVVVGAPTFSEALALKAAATNSLDIQAQKSVRSNMVSDLRSRLGELLAKNERAPALEKLDRDEFVLDVAGRDRILEANVLRAKDAISKLDAEDAVRDACAEKIRQDCWASMDVHATEIHALNRDRPCVANFPLVKRSAKVLGQLRKVRDLRKLELRDISRGGKACVVWPVEAAVEAAVPADVDWILNHGVLKPFESAQAAKDSVRDGEYGDEDGDVVAEAVLNFEDVGTQMYPPTSVVTPSQKRFQALVAAQVARELQAQFNARFVKLQKEKSDEADKLEERNVVIRGILDEFKSDEPWPAPHFDRAAELPESLLTVLDDEVGVDDADTNAAPAAVVKKKADGDDGALRALEDMMHGTLNVPGEADLLELEIVAPEWLEGLGDAEMNEDQKKSFHVYEAATKLRAEEREKRRKARELELKKLRTEVSDLTKSFDEKVRALDKDRVEAMAAVVAQELYGLRLAAALVDQEDMAATGKRLVVKDSKLRVLVADHEALLAELYEAVDSNAASLDALQAEDRLLERNFLKDFGAALDADAQRAAAVLYKFRDSDSRAGRNAKEISKDPFHATVAEAGGDWTRTDDAAKLDDAALQGVKELRLRKVRKETDIADALASLKASSAEQHVAAAVVAQLRNDVLDVAAERRALAESVNLSNRNCEILVRLKQGQDEVEQEAVVTDYGDAVLIPAALVHTVNLEIRRLGLEQVKVLSKIKNFRKSINYLQWEDEFGLLKATDLEEYHTDLQLMHVTKGLQAVLQGDPAQREREHALKVEKRVKLMDSVHAEACTKLHRANAKLAHRTRERSDENNRLRAQLRELELSVSAREGVFRGSGAGGDGTARAAAAAADMKRVVLRRRLLDLARLQSEECDFLRQELDRLRQRTFPSFAYATRDRNAGD